MKKIPSILALLALTMGMQAQSDSQEVESLEDQVIILRALKTTELKTPWFSEREEL